MTRREDQAMSRPTKASSHAPARAQRAPQGPSQRQLRAGELVRHALVEILREEDLLDPALAGVSVTMTEVRMSPGPEARPLLRRAARRRPCAGGGRRR